ncbi:MAG: nucleotidyl transferase AbiEii/AbiGii toxin family protein [Leptolyngbya sp. PLA2]|nr:nucleotidyl transferase AbiEii/AbiGii toxin family protein [Leptolyngbya sp.]MCE7972697.1 nucleotidyl transferase AbiEii/AbiGii toxin family protein [Leptolyngbya sp. PL-A2]MCQ3939473.1 nucleotidyl transferase AbiEii/AbiGii toxin family protein [cyanobacterium CYA1]MDL1903731.1 nucleotidyl transferase AbiEii/AbiGii toxin family protein [Synechococcales cyanobacterium CNB]
MSGVSASVKQRLLNYSRERGEVFNLVLVRFAVERLLYRLTRSPYADAFVLKGAMLFAAWTGKPHRPTQDVDLLGFGEPSADRLAKVFREIAAIDVEPDGLAFDPASVRVEAIREEAIYDGLRVRMLAFLGTARIPLQIDVGFGDAITPGPRELTFGPMLDLPAPRLRTYPPETVVAEKLDAIIVLGMANSRMKDYFDLWTLRQTTAFEMDLLRAAIAATLERRGTPMPTELPIGLTDAFANDDSKRKQWAGFIRKMGDVGATRPLAEVVELVRTFLEPVLVPLSDTDAARWPAGGPWSPSSTTASDGSDS